jgi:glycerol kinase
MTGPVVAIDAGTTSIRAIVVDERLVVLGRAVERAAIQHPAPGRVEQNAEQLWNLTQTVVEHALANASVRRDAVAAIGITTQRGNVVLWDRTTGRPVAPLVSWQDLRGTDRAAELMTEGFMLTHQTSAAKLEAVLAGVDRGRERLNDGSLLWGNLDTYLAWRLSGGDVYATEPGQACATGYYDYFNGAWNGALIEVQGLDRARFPLLCDTTAPYGHTAQSVFGVRFPLGALVADQQSAAIAQGCVQPGTAKVTYGTSATYDANTGADLELATGAYPMVLWQRAGTRTFCIEGMVNTAGAMIDWAVDELGLAASAGELSRLAGSVSDTAGAYVLPALQGLGTPHGDGARRASIGGLSRATTRAHIARAVFDGIAYRVREVHDAIRSVLDGGAVAPLRVDGGASRSDVLMQLQADALGEPLERLAIADAAALGAAICAGDGAGLWDANDMAALRHADRIFEPRLSADERDAKFALWRENCRV